MFTSRQLSAFTALTYGAFCLLSSSSVRATSGHREQFGASARTLRGEKRERPQLKGAFRENSPKGILQRALKKGKDDKACDVCVGDFSSFNEAMMTGMALPDGKDGVATISLCSDAKILIPQNASYVFGADTSPSLRGLNLKCCGESCIIDGQDLDRENVAGSNSAALFHILETEGGEEFDMSVNGITFQFLRATSGGSGAVFYIDDDDKESYSLQIEGCTFDSNRAMRGAVVFTGESAYGTVVSIGNEFIDNVAHEYGGVFYVNYYSALVSKDDKFVDNFGQSRGAVLYTYFGWAIITRAEVIDNGSFNGSFYNHGIVIFNDCSFSDSKAPGGAKGYDLHAWNGHNLLCNMNEDEITHDGSAASPFTDSSVLCDMIDFDF